MKKETTLTTKTKTATLAQRVADHYDNCLEVNGGWCEFTNELAVLNLLECLDEMNYEFVAELMMGDDEFSNENREELVEAVGLYLVDKKVPAEWVDATMLVTAMEVTDCDPAVVAELALDAGVDEEVVIEFLAEVA